MVVSLKVLPYGLSLDKDNEFCELSAFSVHESFLSFGKEIVNVFVPEYLRHSTSPDLKRILRIIAAKNIHGVWSVGTANIGNGRTVQLHELDGLKGRRRNQNLSWGPLPTESYKYGYVISVSREPSKILTNWRLPLLLQRLYSVTWYRSSSSVWIGKDTSIYISQWMDFIHTILFLILQLRNLYQKRIKASPRHRKLSVSTSRGL